MLVCMVVAGAWFAGCGDSGTGPDSRNRAPEAAGSIPDQELHPGDSVIVDVRANFSDPDGDALAFAAESSDPRLVSVTVAGAAVSVRAAGQGTATVTVTATDPGGLAATQRFQVTVPNRAPAAVGAIPDDTVAVGDSIEVDASAYFTDPDGDALTIAAASSDTAVVTTRVAGDAVTVTARARGEATVTVTAADPGGLEAARSFRVVVPNRAPEPAGAIPADTVEVGDSVVVDVSAYFTDPDGDALTYSVESSDASVATASAAGGMVTVGGVSRGTATVTVTATDPGAWPPPRASRSPCPTGHPRPSARSRTTRWRSATRSKWTPRHTLPTRTGMRSPLPPPRRTRHS